MVCALAAMRKKRFYHRLKKVVVNQIIEPTPSLASNQVEELQYFAAHLCLCRKKQLFKQQLILMEQFDLKKKNYSDVNFSIGVVIKRVWTPTLTRVGNITIKQGQMWF
jgi:hypothetical protein